MRPLSSLATDNYDYAIARDPAIGWVFLRSNGKKLDRFPLDLDRRHQRFFLDERDQRRVGIEGISALETLARDVLPR